MSLPSLQDKVLHVTGSRTITSWPVVNDILNIFQGTPKKVVHGGASGVDTLAGRWAREHYITVEVRRPDLKKYPITRFKWRAYDKRDEELVDMADYVVAIWNGSSGGTKRTRDYAKKQGKLCLTMIVDGQGKTTRLLEGEESDSE